MDRYRSEPPDEAVPVLEQIGAALAGAAAVAVAIVYVVRRWARA